MRPKCASDHAPNVTMSINILGLKEITGSPPAQGGPWQPGTLSESWLCAQTCSAVMLWAADWALGSTSYCSLAAPAAHGPENGDERGNSCSDPNEQHNGSSSHVLSMYMSLWRWPSARPWIPVIGGSVVFGHNSFSITLTICLFLLLFLSWLKDLFEMAVKAS